METAAVIIPKSLTLPYISLACLVFLVKIPIISTLFSSSQGVYSMRFILPALLVFGFVASPSQGEILTQKEISDGWILLFDGETTFGWKIDGNAEVKDGALILGGKKATTAEFTTRFYGFELVFQAKGPAPLAKFKLEAGKKEKHNTLPFKSNDWRERKYVVRLGKTKGKRDYGWVFEIDSNKSIGTESETLDSDESITFKIQVPAGSKVHLKDMKLKPLDTKSIFNGKDLSGWKVLPGYKSKYTVTKDGYLNVKNGRGDIQTTEMFRDFVLQLDCISNGKHLNSGIFFRCIPNQYQQGYEAQIRNQFTPGQKRTYILDKYNPQNKIESTAVDFGTGGIYRRIPARKGVSQDKEWFTMTIVAQGNHFATWVNGIQVTDWTDHRPLNDNARRGCCLNPGAISIQGHDPTTDLSFRNFRIAEIPSSLDE